jgi:hypothetical protein
MVNNSSGEEDVEDIFHKGLVYFIRLRKTNIYSGGDLLWLDENKK